MNQTIKKNKDQFVSNRELKAISKSNVKEMTRLEKFKKRRASELEYSTELVDENNALEIDNLHTYFFTDVGVAKAVNGVSFNVPKGSTVGVVGESGCGKSVTSLSVLQLVQAPQGQIVDGEIRFKFLDYKKDTNGKHIPIYLYDENGEPIYEPVYDKKGLPVLVNGEVQRQPAYKRDRSGFVMFEKEEKTFNIAKMPIKQMQKIRGKEIAMIFQEPMTSLNPVFTIGYQLREAVLQHTPGISAYEAKARCIEMLGLVGIAMAEHVYKSYPHQLSGGMRQRVMIAMALSCNPKLIIADEPTTALDVTIQAQILELLRTIKTKTGTSILLITHDLGVIAEMADFVVVMYAGRIIEKGTVYDIFDKHLQPYTIGLEKSKPVVGGKSTTLYSIPGRVPNPIDMPNHCYFYDRCNRKSPKCKEGYPELRQISDTHSVACYTYEKELNEYEAKKVTPKKSASKATKEEEVVVANG